MRRGKAALLLLASSICTAVLMALWPVQSALQVETAVVGSGELVRTLLLSGRVQYAQQPCISLKSGIVKQVHVTVGQQVESGQLLFSLDTSAEEQALAALHAQKHAQQTVVAGLDDAAAALAVQPQLDLADSERQLLASIEASKVRAAVDGIVQTIYVQPGEMVTEAALLGAIRGTELEIAASAPASDVNCVSTGAAAIAECRKQNAVPLVLSNVQPAENAGMQILSFQALTDAAWKAGDTAEVEMIMDVHPGCVLIPLSAVGVDDEVWFIKEGRAYSASLQTDLYNRSHAAAPLEWAGRTVILYPEQYDLAEGTPVKKAGTQ